MKRRALTILSTLSLLLFIASTTLWLRSHRTHDSILYRTTKQYWHLASSRGRLWMFIHEPRHRLIRKAYVSQMPGAGGALAQTSEELASVAYDRVDGAPRLHFMQYPVLESAEEIETALLALLRCQRDTSDVESDLAGLHANLHIGRITDEAIVRRAERPYVQAMEQQMRAWSRVQAAVAPDRGRAFLGFHWYPGEGPAGVVPSPSFAAPYWSLLLIAASVPAAQLLSLHRARRRTRHALCPNCGYDLRASPERCPECGFTPTANTAL